ncbi:hypothetical protein [Glutamicibacter sp.]|jgi:hypothetical protein|uniref:hypothetical protein n=1 Tax=Glutamicibacter sp. TaxID=1931995 RepID=UPI002B475771|nr:hypothetical protein [Glutamicibacter sp.]HJX78578.1 hypothetical protein [Glutamicibacter sp.]
MTDQPTRENVESETDLSSDLQRTVVGSVPGVGNMGVSTTSTAPLNQDALEAGAKALLAVQQPEVSADYAWNVQFEDGRDELRNEARAAVSAYLGALSFERSNLMSGPRISTDDLRKLRGIVESGTPLARNTVLRLIEQAFMEATN